VRRSRGHDCRHNTSSLVHSSAGTYTRSVSLSPSLPPFSLRLRLSSEFSRFLLHRTCVSSRCKRSRAHACTRVHAYTRGRARLPASRVSRGACSLASRLSFFLPPLSPRRHVEGNFTFSPPTLLIRVSTLSRPRKHGTHRDRAIY